MRGERRDALRARALLLDQLASDPRADRATHERFGGAQMRVQLRNNEWEKRERSNPMKGKRMRTKD